jgi:hypothetical protein
MVRGVEMEASGVAVILTLCVDPDGIGVHGAGRAVRYV